MHPIFLEIIIAPSYSAEALAILTNKKKNLRILELAFDAQDASEVEKEFTGVVGGLLVQDQDVVVESPADWEVVTERQPSKQEWGPWSSPGSPPSMSSPTASSSPMTR